MQSNQQRWQSLLPGHDVPCYSCTLISLLKGGRKEELFKERTENYGFEEIIQRNIVQENVQA